MSKFTTAKSLHCAVAKTTCVRLPPATSAALFSTISLTMRLVTSSRPLHKSASSQEHKYMPLWWVRRGPIYRAPWVEGQSERYDKSGPYNLRYTYMPHTHRQEKLGELIAVELSELIRTRL